MAGIFQANEVVTEFSTEPDGKLAALGISPENITASSECTYELPEKYFSYRRDKPEIKETMLAVIGLK